MIDGQDTIDFKWLKPASHRLIRALLKYGPQDVYDQAAFGGTSYSKQLVERLVQRGIVRYDSTMTVHPVPGLADAYQTYLNRNKAQ